MSPMKNLFFGLRQDLAGRYVVQERVTSVNDLWGDPGRFMGRKERCTASKAHEKRAKTLGLRGWKSVAFSRLLSAQRVRAGPWNPVVHSEV